VDLAAWDMDQSCARHRFVGPEIASTITQASLGRGRDIVRDDCTHSKARLRKDLQVSQGPAYVGEAVTESGKCAQWSGRCGCVGPNQRGNPDPWRPNLSL